MQIILSQLFVVLLALGLALPFSASAAVPITVTIDGQTVTGTDCKILSGASGASQTYNKVTISGWSISGTMKDARIGTGCADTTDDDTQMDALRFLTAVVRPLDSTAVNVEKTIEFVGTYNDPPHATAADSTQIWYKLSGNGNFRRSNGSVAQGAVVKLWGYVEATAGSGSWTQITSSFLSKTIQLTSGFFGVPPLTQVFPSPEIPASPTQHNLKGVLKFTFKTTSDELRIDNTTGIVLYSSGSPGPGDMPGIHVPPVGGSCPDDVTCLPPPQVCSKGKQCMACTMDEDMSVWQKIKCRWFGSCEFLCQVGPRKTLVGVKELE